MVNSEDGEVFVGRARIWGFAGKVGFFDVLGSALVVAEREREREREKSKWVY